MSKSTRIADEVNKARIHEEWRVKYMSILLRNQEILHSDFMKDWPLKEVNFFTS